ncbi:MAG: TIGR04282 family arsenosugar biosynthesis glycosyltransferase [Candidatus Methylacidiphilales bacterium]
MKMMAALMLKAPRPGWVKTRLAADLGTTRATAIYRHVVEHQMRHIPPDWACTIHYSPPDAGEEMRAWLQDKANQAIAFAPQNEGDLGARMLGAVRHGLAHGAEGVVLLGGDCPELLKDDLIEAACHLDGADVVIAPATDGGYVLLGLKQAHARLFEDLPWSTSEVLALTLRRVDELGLTVRRMRLFSDVDQIEDAQRFGLLD